MTIKRIRFLVYTSLFCFACMHAVAQPGKIPPFQMLQANGTVFKAQNLPMGKPVILIYFSPDCEHCENLTKALIKRSADFAKTSIAMVTYLPLENLTKFVSTFQLQKYPNIYAGTERSTYFLRNYYNILDLPFLALYTKNGDLVKTYKRDVDLSELSVQVLKLK